nr:hypothetical protein [Tanacetum cinerariifolium]
LRKTKKKDTKLPQTSVPTSVVDEAVNEEMDDSLERAATTATSLDAEQDIGGGPKCQEAMRDTVVQSRVLDLETIKTTQVMKIEGLKRRVKKLERRKRSMTHGLKKLYKVGLSERVESSKDKGLGKEDASKQGMIADIDANEDIYLVNVHKDEDMNGVNDSDGDEVIAKDAEMLFDVADDLIGEEFLHNNHHKSRTRAKAKWLNLKCEEIIIKRSLMLDEELAFKLQGREEEEEIISKEEAQQIEEVNIAWDDVQAKIDDDYELAQRLQEELTDAKKAKLFMQFLEKRRITKLVEESSKKAEVEITQEDHGDDVTINATPLSSKSPTIVDYKIYKEGKKIYFQIFNANGNSQTYLTFSKMLKNFDREDLEVLWRLVKTRFEKI